MQYDIAYALVDIYVTRLAVLKQLGEKIYILIQQQPHSCVRKYALTFLEQNANYVVGDECGRILSEIELMRAAISNEFDFDEYLPFTIDQERLVNGNNLYNAFYVAKRTQAYFYQLLHNMRAEGVVFKTESLYMHSESFNALLYTCRSRPQTRYRPETAGYIYKHKIYEYYVVTNMPELPSRCISAKLLTMLNVKQRSKSYYHFRTIPGVVSRNNALKSQAAVRLEYYYRECEEQTKKFRRSALKQRAYLLSASYPAYPMHLAVLPRSRLIKRPALHTDNGSLQDCGLLAAHRHRFSNYPYPPPFSVGESDNAALCAERVHKLELPRTVYCQVHGYENALFASSDDYTQNSGAKAMIVVKNRWIIAQNDFDELALLSLEVYQAVTKRVAIEQHGAQYHDAFNDWAERVREIAAHAEIPEHYAVIDDIYCRRTSYTNIITGKSQNLKPEVAAVQKWIDAEWKKYTYQVGQQADSTIADAHRVVNSKHYFLTHRCVGCALMDHAGLDAAHDALKQLVCEKHEP